MTESIIYTRPAPGWGVHCDPHHLGQWIYNGTALVLRRRTDDRRAACRYTWERWALEVLGPVVDAGYLRGWQELDGHRAVSFEGGLTIICDPTGYWVHMEEGEYTDPVAALAAAALESIRRQL